MSDQPCRPACPRCGADPSSTRLTIVRAAHGALLRPVAVLMRCQRCRHAQTFGLVPALLDQARRDDDEVLEGTSLKQVEPWPC